MLNAVIARALQRPVEDRVDLELASGLERVGIERRIPPHGARGPDNDPFDLSNARDDRVGEPETDAVSLPPCASGFSGSTASERTGAAVAAGPRRSKVSHAPG